jgi:hypothetical protein
MSDGYADSVSRSIGYASIDLTRQMYSFASAIAALEREECAKMVAREWDHFKALRDAHYRHSPAEFNPDDFGINMEVVRLSERICDEIRRK